MAVAGYGTALLYVLFRAPDLALTLILVETVSLVLLLLMFRRLPPLAEEARPRRQRIAHALLAGMMGVCAAALAYRAGAHQAADPAGAAHIELSLPEAKGRNVVNVILVDFRGVDTLGEIAVLAMAALSMVALLRDEGPAASPHDQAPASPHDQAPASPHDQAPASPHDQAPAASPGDSPRGGAS
jgi:multisubunit Na+/H+ antiporter MnhB subunit